MVGPKARLAEMDVVTAGRGGGAQRWQSEVTGVRARPSVPLNLDDPVVPRGKRWGLWGWAGGLESLDFPPWSEGRAGRGPLRRWVSAEREGQQGV